MARKEHKVKGSTHSIHLTMCEGCFTSLGVACLRLDVTGA